MTEPGISALETLLPLTLALVHEGVLTPLAATARLTLGPARIAGLDAGTITVGSAADLVLLGPRHPWTLRAEHLRSEEHTSELQSLMRISSDVLSLKKQKTLTRRYHISPRWITITEEKSCD